jgi:hypothetical protein
LGINCAVQGEIIGEGIQKNRYKMHGQTVMFFNFFYIDTFQYAGYDDFKQKMKELNLTSVPVINENYNLENDMESLVKMSIGKSLLSDCQREGIVIRPLNEIIDRDNNGLLNNNRVSLKVINPEYLLKYEN